MSKEIEKEFEVMFATTLRRRLFGLLFVAPREEVLVLCPCKSVHTWGMRHALDIALIDEVGRVLKVGRAVSGAKVIGHHRACAVLERFACDDRWFELGERVRLGTPG